MLENPRKNNGNNANNNKPYEPTVYSNYKFNNYDSPLGMVNLNLSFWNNMLKIAIVPIIKRNNSIEYDNKNEIFAHVNHTKARMLSNELKKFLDNNILNNGSGINTGTGDNAGVITISDGSDFGINSACLCIRKIDPNGNVLAAMAYPFNTNKYSVKDINKKSDRLNPDDIKMDYESYVDIEIKEIIAVLDSYAEAMTSALAYSVVNASKWDYYRFNKKLDSISDALGVSTKQSSGRSGGFFQNNQNYGNNRGYNNYSSSYGDVDE